MADYIVTADIRHRHFRKFSPTDLQSYVDDANARFFDYAVSLGVLEAEIASPLPTIAKSFILADMYMQIAGDNAGSEGNLIGEANLYSSIYALYSDQYAKLKPQMTKNMITGAADSPANSAVVFGRLIRG